MKIYLKHVASGFAISLVLFMIPLVFNKPDEIGVILLFSPVVYGIILKQPVIVVAILTLVLRKIDVKLNPYVFSSSLVIFTLVFSFLGYFFIPEILVRSIEGSRWEIWLISIISCAISVIVIYRKKKI